MLLETFRDITGVCGNIAKGVCEGFCGTSESTEKHNYCTLFFMHPVFQFLWHFCWCWQEGLDIYVRKRMMRTVGGSLCFFRVLTQIKVSYHKCLWWWDKYRVITSDWVIICQHFQSGKQKVTGVIHELGHHPKKPTTLITDLVHQGMVQQTFAALVLFLFVCFHEIQSSVWDHSSFLLSPRLIFLLPFAYGFVMKKQDIWELSGLEKTSCTSWVIFQGWVLCR